MAHTVSFICIKGWALVFESYTTTIEMLEAINPSLVISSEIDGPKGITNGIISQNS